MKINVIPAKAVPTGTYRPMIIMERYGIQVFNLVLKRVSKAWIPAFAGMTAMASSAFGAADPSLLEIFQDEVILTVENIPYEPQPTSVRLFDDSAEAMKPLFQPSALMTVLLLQSGRKTTDDELGFESISFTTASFSPPDLVEKRARDFEQAGWLELARDEYAFLLEIDPQNKRAKGLLDDLKERQKQRDRAAEARRRMDALVKKDLDLGIEHYRHGRTDEAVASFVRVLNMDPENAQAASYLKKIEGQLR